MNIPNGSATTAGSTPNTPSPFFVNDIDLSYKATVHELQQTLSQHILVSNPPVQVLHYHSLVIIMSSYIQTFEITVSTDTQTQSTFNVNTVNTVNTINYLSSITMPTIPQSSKTSMTHSTQSSNNIALLSRHNGNVTSPTTITCGTIGTITQPTAGGFIVTNKPINQYIKMEFKDTHIMMLNETMIILIYITYMTICGYLIHFSIIVKSQHAI